MNCRSLFFIILTLLSSNKSWGQFTALNSYFNLATNGYTYFLDVKLVDDSLTIFGDIAEDTISKRQNVFLARMDTLGNISKIKFFFDPLGQSENLINRNAQISTTLDGGYIFTTVPFERNNNVVFYKTNKNFELEFAKEFELDNCTVYSINSIEVENSYFIGLDVCTQNGNDHDYCIVKTDLHGNKLWHKFYGTEDNYEWLRNIKSFKYGEVTLLGNQSINNQGRVAITTIVTSGMVVKEIFNMGDGEGNIYDIDTLDNGDYIYICSQLKDIVDYNSSLRIYRIDSQGEVIWKKVINDDVFNAYLYRMHRNANGTYTIIGKEEGKGRSLCITQDGEVLWQHIYKLPFSPMPIQYYSGLLGMTALPSGNIIACGYFRDLTDLKDEEQGWLVKLDADGCIDKNCKTLLGDQEVIEIDELKVGVYPNPSNGLLKVNIPYGQNMDDCMIKIYDIVGNVILNKKLFEGVNDIDLGKDVTSGVLIYNVSSDSGKSLKSGKLIITK